MMEKENHTEMGISWEVQFPTIEWEGKSQ